MYVLNVNSFNSCHCPILNNTTYCNYFPHQSVAHLETPNCSVDYVSNYLYFSLIHLFKFHKQSCIMPKLCCAHKCSKCKELLHAPNEVSEAGHFFYLPGFVNQTVRWRWMENQIYFFSVFAYRSALQYSYYVSNVFCQVFQ